MIRRKLKALTRSTAFRVIVIMLGLVQTLFLSGIGFGWASMSLFLEKMLESFMKEDKEFNRRKKEKSVKLKKEDKSVVLSHKNETVSSVSLDKGQNLNKSMVQEPSKDTKIIEKELFGEAE